MKPEYMARVNKQYIDQVNRRKEFFEGNSGWWFWLPRCVQHVNDSTRSSSESLASWKLRAIADELDRRNEALTASLGKNILTMRLGCKHDRP